MSSRPPSRRKIPESEYFAVMKFLDVDRSYMVANEDTGEMLVLSGHDLASSGIRIVLQEPKSSAIWHIIPEAS